MTVVTGRPSPDALLGRHPSPAAVENRLEQASVDVGPPGFDRIYGAGRLDAAAATDPAR